MRLQILRVRRDRDGGRKPTLGFGSSATEDALARHVITEFRRGRPLAEVLDDPYVTNRADAAARRRLLDRSDVVSAVGEDIVDQLRAGTQPPVRREERAPAGT
jgi:hypothetical protein